MRKRHTQADVAKRAKVSQAMVSYVVNKSNKVTIPQETRERIEIAMRDLGYTPNIVAQRLQSKKTKTIAGIIPDITNPFYPDFERGIQEVVNDFGYDLIIYNTDASLKKELNCLESLSQGRVDGVIGVFFHLKAQNLFKLLEQGVAIIRFEGRLKEPGQMPLDNLFIDNIAASRQATEYLLNRGHKRIAMLSSSYGPARYREKGYLRAMIDAGFSKSSEFIERETFNEHGGYKAMKTLMKQSPVTAILAANDLMAMGAMVAIREAGLSIPKDISVLGFDDIPLAKWFYPPLSTISQSQRQMGRKAAHLLFERIHLGIEEGGRSVEMPFQLVIRESTN
ncbi:MAG: LacI family transcriptional regulator [Dehalococcoidales bacterium]|jgi:LacI family transcriptional regulator|nr:LacI family transcriptional regulator [Dehalococcoidales bacterium]